MFFPSKAQIVYNINYFFMMIFCWINLLSCQICGGVDVLSFENKNLIVVNLKLCLQKYSAWKLVNNININ